MSFPESFLWGAATSSYQIEGATAVDGRSDSVWDAFCRRPGKVRNGDTGDVACDHYHRWEDDVALMAELGLGAYRFSVSWPRVLPDGRGPVNQQGLDFYDRLVDGLLDAGIEPFVTLYHWDHPQVLEAGGGWRTRDIVEPFAEYAAAVAGRLADRITNWFTHNEPWVVAHLGHRTGQHAPGLVESGTELDVAHHLLVSHGLATQALRSVNDSLRIGIVLNLEPRPPRSAHPADLAVARREEGLLNDWFVDPLVGDGYPADLVEASGWDRGVVRDGDMDLIAQPLDTVGLNYYRVETVWDETVPDSERPAPVLLDPADQSEMGWPVVPEGLRQMLELLDERGFESIYITENGGAFPDEIARPDGSIEDDDRLSYYQRHLEVVDRAIVDGIPVDGFFAWSLLDNFEWSFGYDRRFGIVHVDFESQARTPKKSARWYADVIARNGLPR